MLLLIPVPILERASCVINVEPLASRRITGTWVVVAFWITRSAIIGECTPIIESIAEHNVFYSCLCATERSVDRILTSRLFIDFFDLFTI